MAESNYHSRNSSTGSLRKHIDSDLPLEPLSRKSKSTRPIRNQYPLLSKLVYSQGKLQHSSYQELPGWLHKKTGRINPDPEVLIRPDNEKELESLVQFFEKKPRLCFDASTSLNLLNVKDIVAQVSGSRKITHRRTGKTAQRVVFKSRRSTTAFHQFNLEDNVIDFSQAVSEHFMRHRSDDDVDTDEEQMKQGILKCFKNLVKGIKQEAATRLSVDKAKGSPLKQVQKTMKEEQDQNKVNQKINQ